jgi:hypothetical protein
VHQITDNVNCSEDHAFWLIAAVLVIMVVGFSCKRLETPDNQKGFATAKDAVQAFIAAYKTYDEQALLKIFGDEAKELIYSGDPVIDQQVHDRFLSEYEDENRMIEEGENMILVVGDDDWPFSIPLVKKEDQWVFDTEAGKEEILNRRIGRNELNTIQTMLAIVDAQREYAMEDRDNDVLREYAQKFMSDEGERNGLFWMTKEGEEQSPLGLLVAEGAKEGYRETQTTGRPSPYHGYYYRILTAQGKNAPGGAFDYMVKGSMMGGFAVVAYPAEYDNSGIMTFMVNHKGIVYQKDLGEDTEQTANAIEMYDPDETWMQVDSQDLQL